MRIFTGLKIRTHRPGLNLRTLDPMESNLTITSPRRPTKTRGRLFQQYKLNNIKRRHLYIYKRMCVCLYVQD
jgi:hypothetical protein